MELEEILKQTIDNLKQVTDTESVVGKPVVSADGTIVAQYASKCVPSFIPVASFFCEKI